MTNGLFNRNSDCCGTVVWERLGAEISGHGKSNTRNRSGNFSRSTNEYIVRRRLVESSGRCSVGRPPVRRSSWPATESIESRIASNPSRRRFMRHNNRFDGSAARCVGRSMLACCQVLESIISRFSFLSDQLFCTNQVARKSSNSGWLGPALRTPKSLGVATKPRPKCQAQTRFTITLAVNGLPGFAIALAKAKRPLPPFIFRA